MAMTGRRPLPALALILLLAGLSTFVWWRVLHPGKPSAGAATVTCARPSAAASTLPPPASVAVRVLNATSTTGLAARTQHDLQARGFSVASIGDAPSPYPGVALIEFPAGGKQAATLLGFYFPGAQVREQDGAGQVVTVSLGAGFKGLPPDPVLAAEFASAHVAPPSPLPAAGGAPRC